MNRTVFSAVLLSLAFTAGNSKARPVTNDVGITQQYVANIEWFEDAKFGMFLHWGIYSVSGRGEWFFENEAMPLGQYRKYAFDQCDGIYPMPKITIPPCGLGLR